MTALGDRLIEVEWGHMQLYGIEHVHEWLDLGENSMQLSALVEQ